MENKINVAQLLKDCPKGMELDCTMFENVTFIGVGNIEKQFPIEIKIGGNKTKYLTKTGCFHDDTLVPEAKCVIFPKGKTTWEGFQRPFKDGDILATILGSIFIYKKIDIYKYCGSYVSLDIHNGFLPTYNSYLEDCSRLATEEEKEKLFDTIKANGYKWNAETKTLEKLIEPKFKVGDRIRHKETNKDDVYKISKVYDDSYGLVGFTWMIYMKYQDQYELAPNKFDINTLVPFESKVLVRNDINQLWIPAFWGYKRDNGYATTFGWCQYCIPFKGNEHLLNTADDCDDFYKTWEK